MLVPTHTVRITNSISLSDSMKLPLYIYWWCLKWVADFNCTLQGSAFIATAGCIPVCNECTNYAVQTSL